jgi:hypothetical protein
MVVVCPFRLQISRQFILALCQVEKTLNESNNGKSKAYKVIGKFEARKVCVGILKVDNHKLLVLIRRQHQR